MPTTLFVLVNAVINAFRTVDHIIVMTRGGPDNATTLLLYYVYEVGFKFWDSTYAAALTVILLVLLAAVGIEPIRPARAADPLPMSASAASVPYALHGAGRALESAAAWLLAILWLLPLLYALWTAFHPAEFSARFICSRPADAREFCARVARGTVRALLPQHLRAGDADSQLSARPVHAGRLRLCALRVCRARARLRARSAPADDHAGRAHRRELSHHVLARPCRYHSGDRAAVRRFRLRHLPAAADLQEHSERARRRRARRGRRTLAGAAGGSTCRSRSRYTSPMRSYR